MVRPQTILSILSLVCLLWASTPSAVAALESTATPVEVASITGEVYFDANLNRMREPWERGMRGVEVFLLDGAGRTVEKVVTDADGYYQFRNLGIARFLLSVAAPLGYVATSNGSFSVSTSEVSAPLVYSTAINAGIYFPHILSG